MKNNFQIVLSKIKMSYAMDKAMMALSLEEEDEPFNMPDLPQFNRKELEEPDWKDFES